MTPDLTTRLRQLEAAAAARGKTTLLALHRHEAALSAAIDEYGRTGETEGIQRAAHGLLRAVGINPPPYREVPARCDTVAVIAVPLPMDIH